MNFKFFITPVYPYGNDHYYHETISLAEGLTQLGHTVFGNCNYWLIPDKGEYLIREDNTTDYEVAVYDYRYVMSFEHLLFKKGYPYFDFKKKLILIDRNDWLTPKWLNPHYRIFNTIFSCDLRSDYDNPSNVKPWAFGLTQRMIDAIDVSITHSAPNLEIAHNYRVPHNLRKHLLKLLNSSNLKYPLQERFTSWQPEQSNYSAEDTYYYGTTTRRHNPDFYKLLNSTAIFCAFGGYFETKPFRYQPYTLLDKIVRKPYFWYYNFLQKNNKDITSSIFLFQCDSFRLWETFYSAACPLHIDYDYWNLILPVKPVNGEHYLGIKDLSKESIETLLDVSPEEIAKIGQAGRGWARQNYSPKAIASRFIEQL